ncbi:MAG TPA: DUF3078 domain-containing protein [Paludibacteraceae bacterium]|jgi:hypothetical protein|nr:DUF3078 domain-containing protein [Paludibacteraceae bacterium]HPS10440.1 DUF3078 domain-containing protein [Paludibacteraceae bacterium]
MKKYVKILSLIVFVNFYAAGVFSAVRYTALTDTLTVVDTTNNPRSSFGDSLRISKPDTTQLLPNNTLLQKNDSVFHAVKPVYKYTLLTPSGAVNVDNSYFVNKDVLNHRLDSLMKLPQKPTDSLLYAASPFHVPLIFMGKNLKPVWDGHIDYQNEFYGKKMSPFEQIQLKSTSSETLVDETRKIARNYISSHALHLYETTLDRLPDPGTFTQKLIKHKAVETFTFEEKGNGVDVKKIEVVRLKPRYWNPKATALMQFTQNYISQNWYQGGNSNLAILNILSGELNYDNKKDVQWENKMEWRAGFNSVVGDTIRKISTNDDLLRYTSKFGLKASGNWYYSVSGDFSTQLFDTYKAINSTQYKARLLTPFRANVGIGMDYKYKKLLSLMIAPLSFKYIYANDTANVNPNLFGIEKGKNQLRQVGSSFRAQLNYSPSRQWQLDSRLTFYTDYKKVEIDWEMVSNLSVNRFMSVRIALNPRYDNTVILKKGENARLQFKQLLSVGFSYRLL